MEYKNLIKRIPIIFLKGIIIYWIAMSNTTTVIGRITIRQNHSKFSLIISTLLISLLIGIITEITKEI